MPVPSWYVVKMMRVCPALWVCHIHLPLPYVLQGYTRDMAYIITQHPLETTCEDFWKMVLSQKVNCIAMIGSIKDEKVCALGGFYLGRVIGVSTAASGGVW